MASEKPNIKSVREVISRVSSVKSLTAASARLANIDRMVKSLLPSLLADYCQIKACSDKELIIEAYSQAVATHLRFSSPKLLEKLRKNAELSNIVQISIKVGTVTQVEKVYTPTQKPNPISEVNRQMLLDTANAVSSPELKASLLRLANTLAKHRKNKPPL